MPANCPQCRAPISSELPGGLCPACLMSAAQASQDQLDPTRGMPSRAGVPSVEEIARLFPELEVESLVGHGGMGAVYRVRQKNLDRIVALKVFLVQSEDPSFAARFQREARALAKLNHPNIVTVHDFGERGHLHYLVMEFVEGLNLRQITNADRLSPAEALQMVPQLCDALQYAHDQGVIHRDIKPENLLLDVHGRIKIADFGLAKMTGAAHDGTLTRTEQVMGTLNYMAPEQRERPTEVDHRADIYSLGVVIYELLTGELPLGRFQPPSSKSPVTAALDDVVMRALEKEPERRYQQASEFKTGFTSAPWDGAAAFAGGRPREPVPPVKSAAQFSPWDEGARYSVAVFSSCEKKGSWIPGEPHNSVAIFGATDLDLTQVQADLLEINLFPLFGWSEIIVPRGAQVDLNGFVIFGSIEDAVEPYDGPQASTMRIRIRCYGGFGGCEVRTPTEKEVPLPSAFQAPQAPFKPGSIKQVAQSGLLLTYRFLAVLVLISCPILFIAGGLNLLEDDLTRMLGIQMAIAGGMLLAGQKYIRMLVGLPPEKDDPASLAEFERATIPGTLVKYLALMVLFACPALFIAGQYMDSSENLFRFSALAAAMLAWGLFWLGNELNHPPRQGS